MGGLRRGSRGAHDERDTGQVAGVGGDGVQIESDFLATGRGRGDIDFELEISSFVRGERDVICEGLAIDSEGPALG
jgi:hypothetical protein